MEAALGSPEKRVQPEERELRAFARRTIFTTRAITEGERLRRDDLAILRAGNLPYGLHPREYPRLLGRRARRSLEAGATLEAEQLEPLRLELEDVTLRPMEAGDTANIVAWRGRADVASQFFSERGPRRASTPVGSRRSRFARTGSSSSSSRRLSAPWERPASRVSISSQGERSTVSCSAMNGHADAASPAGPHRFCSTMPSTHCACAR